MTGKTVCVSLDSNRDGLRGTGALMTGCAALRRTGIAPCMRRMVELHVKTFVELGRKRIHGWRSGLQIAVAGGADARFGIRKLVHVAAYTGIMSGEFQIGQTSFALMA